MPIVCHISDWHGHWRKVPEADIYICTGDMLPNYPHPVGLWGQIIRELEVEGQTKWMQEQKEAGGLRRFLGNPDAPVAVVRGNHDFIDLGPWFGGEYFEVDHDASRVVEYCGLRIGGFRGIPIIAGEWSDEMCQIQRAALMGDIPRDLDIIISHAPPKKILAGPYGCTEYAWLMEKWQLHRPELCCFGHVHEDGGRTVKIKGTIFSNAATKFNVVEL